MRNEDLERVVTGVLCLWCAIVALIIGHFSTRNYYRAQAIRSGCASYAIEDSTNGSTKFEWKPERKAP